MAPEQSMGGLQLSQGVTAVCALGRRSAEVSESIWSMTQWKALMSGRSVKRLGR